MKLNIIILVLVALLAGAEFAFAGEDAVNVGNKICPISGKALGSMGDGMQVEYEGKIYNLCCAMCAKDFNKDPETFIKKIHEELDASDHEVHERKDSHDHDSHD